MNDLSLNMQYLTETLLWLSRKELQTLSGKQFELDSLLEETVDEMNHVGNECLNLISAISPRGA